MPADIRGILLCGGASTRFGANKLLATPPGAASGHRVAGLGVAALSARNLVAGAGRTLAVIRPGEQALRAALVAEGCEVIESERAARGIGASLAAAVDFASDASGWVVALGDMPFIRPETIRAVYAALEAGAMIAAPLNAVMGERWGHPVGFVAALRAELVALDGDEGARSVIARHRHAMVPVPVDDPGIFMDIDTPQDFHPK